MKPWKEQFADSTARRSAEVAHDLKTPLNVAVLNLELARMKVRRIAEPDDGENIGTYLKAVEAELRRMARIFDAYFVYVVPPREERPERVELAPLLIEAFEERGVAITGNAGGATPWIHEERANVLVSNMVEGTLAVLDPVDGIVSSEAGDLTLILRGKPRKSDEEVSKIFKFYYTDAEGAPALGLATARLIAESYGGTLDGRSEDGEIAIELKFPPGDE